MITPPRAVRDRILSLSPTELPAFVYDLAGLRVHAASVRAALPDRVELYYAVRANGEPEILAELGPFVDGYKVSSDVELAQVAEASVARPRAFGGTEKSPTELADALERGVTRFQVESEYELYMLAGLAQRHAPDRRVAVLPRFGLPVPRGLLAADGAGYATAAGLDPAQADTIVGLLTDGSYPNLELRGVHAHLADGVWAGEHLALAGSVVAWTAELAARNGVRLTEVDIGGGMAVDYDHPERRFDWRAYGEGLARLTAAHPELTLRIEPGRALTAYCGWYASEVLDVEHGAGEDVAVVRGGAVHLRTPAAGRGDQPWSVLEVEPWPYSWPRPEVRREHATLTGQLSTPKDILVRAARARGLRAGDRVVFGLAGAYTSSAPHRAHARYPEPRFHFLGDGAHGDRSR
ncbi:type III PLP-dependent enzyme [Streptomyces sp. NPDC006875]|uniref:type III PLP-dependent enzyme n=1 Tax=Streptomyces sp. NPDC006875 TaxID=3154781 RepID=UPI0033EA56B1